MPGETRRPQRGATIDASHVSENPKERSMTSSRWLLVLVWVVLLHLPPTAPTTALAQTCASDAQCRDSGRPRTVCVGNTLVTKQSICSGSCRTVELSRVPCPGPCVADRCVGGSLRSGPLAPPAGGRLPAGVCGQICACKGRSLTYGVGFATRAADCARRSVDCVYGCSCDPEPRCLKRAEARR
jgi:hypothetical protein